MMTPLRKMAEEVDEARATAARYMEEAAEWKRRYEELHGLTGEMIGEARAEVADSEAAIATLRGRLDEALTRVFRAEEKVNQLQGDYQTVCEQNDKLRAEVERLTLELLNAQDTSETQLDLIADMRADNNELRAEVERLRAHAETLCGLEQQAKARESHAIDCLEAAEAEAERLRAESADWEETAGRISDSSSHNWGRAQELETEVERMENDLRSQRELNAEVDRVSKEIADERDELRAAIQRWRDWRVAYGGAMVHETEDALFDVLATEGGSDDR